MTSALRTTTRFLVWFAALAVTMPGLARQATERTNIGMAQRLIALQARPSTDRERRNSPLAPGPERVVEFVRPQDADPAITSFRRDNIVMWNKSVKPNGLLFVMFPGTFGSPHFNQFVLDAAARSGYRAVGLEYVNTTADAARSSMMQLCGQSRDPDCAGAFRASRIMGGTVHGITVPPADGARSRLVKLLQYLAREHPGDGWSAFLKNGEPNWPRIAVGGHSQGAGMAAFIAKQHEVARVVLLSGGIDAMALARRYAAWVTKPSATPPGRWYGMVHEQEQHERGILLGFRELGLPGKPVHPGNAGFAAAHQFVVTAAPRPGGLGDAYHGSTGSDPTTPLDANGRPVFARVWLTMLGGPAPAR